MEDIGTVTTLIELADTITVLAVALLWVRAERTDNNALWRIIERLTETGIRSLDNKVDSDNRE